MRRRDAEIAITQSVTAVPEPSVALYVLHSQLAVVEAAAREDAVVLAFRDDGQFWLRLGSRLIQAATLYEALALAAAPEEPHP